MPTLHFNPITTAEALRAGLLTRSSRQYTVARELRLRYLLLELEGRILVGPAVDAVEICVSVHDRLGLKSFVDLGAGTGATSLALLRRGLPRAILLDRDLRAAKANVRHPRAEFIEADYTSWLPDETVDMVFYDPPRMTKDAGRKVLPRWRDRCHLLLTWAGAQEDLEANLPMRGHLSKFGLDSLSVAAWGADDLLLAMSSHGKVMLDGVKEVLAPRISVGRM